MYQQEFTKIREVVRHILSWRDIDFKRGGGLQNIFGIFKMDVSIMFFPGFWPQLRDPLSDKKDF